MSSKRTAPFASPALLLVLLAAPAHCQSTELVTRGLGGTPANAASGRGVITPDGRYVVYSSSASNLVANDSNGVEDVFLLDRSTGSVERVSLDSAGNQADLASRLPALTPDARFVAFHSAATNLVAGDSNGVDDVYLRDRLLGTTERISYGPGGVEPDDLTRGPVLTPDGRFVVFFGLATNLVPNDTNGDDDLFLRDRLTGALELISVSLAGTPGNNTSVSATISGDGRYVAFSSSASDLVAGDTNGQQDVFVRDRTVGTTALVSADSAGVPSNGFSFYAALSLDGHWVSFSSLADNLVAGDLNARQDVFVRDLASGVTLLASPGLGGAGADGDSFATGIASHGRYVVFDSLAANLVAGDLNARRDVFVRDLVLGTTERASQSSAGIESDNDSRIPAISGDGRFAVFASAAANLVAGDTNGAIDLFVRDHGSLQASAGCPGDGSLAACPCANAGLTGRGCDNSIASGGALLTDTGSHNPDTLVLSAWNLPASALSIFLQGDASIPPANFGDGLRCVGGTLLRLYARVAAAGTVAAPSLSDATITARSAALGDPIAPGTLRHYQVYYRDPSLAFCPAPAGNTWNVSQAISVLW